uniref:Kinesin-like protein n=1 Tax=Spongospora subterranea TaxID=70186 RepID=A0A0H5R7L2_9EUKA|eukprot:CRZ10150.1 hypothetical protein [Spongospora subterranea]
MRPDDNDGLITERQSEASLAFIVAVRVRPESDSELVNPRHSNIIRVLNDNVLVFDPKDPDDEWTRTGDVSLNDGFHGDDVAEPSFGTRKRGLRKLTSSRRPHKDTTFAFDCVFGHNATQQQVYNNTGRVLVNSVFDGFNSTVFAYGATGSGKTCTMVGDTFIGPGVMILSMRDIFEHIQANMSDLECRVQLSYLEVYNEEIKDLLVEQPPLLHQSHCLSDIGHKFTRVKSAGLEKPRRSSKQVPGEHSLALREDPGRGIFVAGLSVHEPTSAVEVFDLLARGNHRRTQCATDANARSSRSHAVLQVTVSVKNRTADCQMEVRTGKLSLVDLAGSERAAVTKNRGSMLREGANINRSLLALGNCINALCKNATGGHVPFRNSKLTRLLKDSLGGNCRTVMIANISPSSLSYDDTQNTLKYSNRAKNIKTFVRKNAQTVHYHVSKYKEIIYNLQHEIQELKNQATGSIGVPTKSICASDSSNGFQEVQTMKQIREFIFQRVSNITDLQTHITSIMCRLAKVNVRNCRSQISSSAGPTPNVSPTGSADHKKREDGNQRTEMLCLIKTLEDQVDNEREQISDLMKRLGSDLSSSNRTIIQLETDFQLEQIRSRECTKRSRFQADLIDKIMSMLTDTERNQQTLLDTLRLQHSALERRSALTDQLKSAWSKAMCLGRHDSETPSLPITPRAMDSVIWAKVNSSRYPAQSMDDSCIPSPVPQLDVRPRSLLGSVGPQNLSRSISFPTSSFPRDEGARYSFDQYTIGKENLNSRSTVPPTPSPRPRQVRGPRIVSNRSRDVIAPGGWRPVPRRHVHQAWATPTPTK